MKQEGVSNPFKFAGGYMDASGYEQFGARYYSPSLGRWTQQDPVAGSLFDLNSANRYIYANDDPVNQVDPSGKSPFWCAFGILAIPATIAGYLSSQAGIMAIAGVLIGGLINGSPFWAAFFAAGLGLGGIITLAVVASLILLISSAALIAILIQECTS